MISKKNPKMTSPLHDTPKSSYSVDLLAEERTLLAAERTFSAWLRTALATMAGGLAIMRLISFKSELNRTVAHIIGETLLLWGCLLIVLSSTDYKNIRNKLVIAENFKSSQVGFIIIVVPLLLISALLVWVTFP